MHRQLLNWSVPAILISLFTLAGCGDKPVAQERVAEVPPAPEVVAEPSPIPEETPTVTFATGWHELVIRSGYTDTHLDTSGHYYIERNACHVGGQGAMKLEQWTIVSTTINVAVPAPEVAEAQEVCVSSESASNYGFNGWVDIKLPNGKKKEKIVEVRGNNVCSRYLTQESTKQLVIALNKFLPEAFQEDCASGR